LLKPASISPIVSEVLGIIKMPPEVPFRQILPPYSLRRQKEGEDPSNFDGLYEFLLHVVKSGKHREVFTVALSMESCFSGIEMLCSGRREQGVVD
jgi:hypothetical protein